MPKVISSLRLTVRFLYILSRGPCLHWSWPTSFCSPYLDVHKLTTNMAWGESLMKDNGSPFWYIMREYWSSHVISGGRSWPITTRQWWNSKQQQVLKSCLTHIQTSSTSWIILSLVVVKGRSTTSDRWKTDHLGNNPVGNERSRRIEQHNCCAISQFHSSHGQYGVCRQL